jgi:hypothetical protein
MDELVTQNGINPKDYTDLFPISVFDVGRHSEKLMASAVDIQIKCRVLTQTKKKKFQEFSRRLHVIFPGVFPNRVCTFQLTNCFPATVGLLELNKNSTKTC